MNRDEKAAVIEQIAAEIKESSAVLAVDYRGITVGQAAELRGTLRAADASFRVVKNSLTERAADQAGVDDLKSLLAGPTALTFVRGDVALAAKAIADQARGTQLLAFKGGVMDGAPLSPEEVSSISRLPARDVLYGQLVGLVASPVTGLVRTLNALISGVAIQLGGILEKKQSGEIPAGDPPAQASADSAAEAPAVDGSPAGESEPPPASEPVESGVGDAAASDPVEAAAETAAEAPSVAAAESGAEAAAGAPATEPVPAAEGQAPDEVALAQSAAPVADLKTQTDPEPDAPAKNDNQADASADPVEAKENH